MKSSINLLLVLSLVFGICCQKKKENLAQSTSSSIVTQVPKKIDGYIDVYYEYKMTTDSFKFRQSMIHAMFYKQAQNEDSIYYFPFDADLGILTINDSTFGKQITGDNIKYYYYPQIPAQIEQIKNTRVWQISGNESFKKMSVIDNTPLPEYFGVILPDTLFKKADNVIKLGHYTGASPIEVTIKFPSGYTRPKTPIRSAKGIIFTELDFSSFFEFEPVNVTIRFDLTNTSYQTVEGKVLCLTSHINYVTSEIPFIFGSY